MNHLLSSYLDGELTGREMNEVRAHLDACGNCQHDYETLRATKRMVASLALKMPREELEGLLIREGRRHETARTQSPLSVRAMAWLLGTHPITLQEKPATLSDRSFLRARPLAATAILSVAGLWIASAALDTSSYRVGAPDDGAWVATANGSGVMVSGSQNGASVPVYGASSYGSLGFVRAAFGPQIPQRLRPAAFAVWMSPSRGDMGNGSPDQAVSLPLVASSSAPPAPWGRSQNGSVVVSVMNGNPTAFVPAPGSENSPLARVSFNQNGH